MRFFFLIFSRRPILRLLLAVWVLAGFAPARAQINLEYDIKAGFLYNFIRMTEWPSGSLPPEGQPIILGVYGANPFGLSLTSLNGKMAKGHPVQVKEISSIDDLKKCQIVFISPSEKEKYSELIK